MWSDFIKILVLVLAGPDFLRKIGPGPIGSGPWIPGYNVDYEFVLGLYVVRSAEQILLPAIGSTFEGRIVIYCCETVYFT